MKGDVLLKPALVVLVASVGLGVAFTAGSHSSPAAARVAPALVQRIARPLHAPRIRLGSSNSTNWSGYVVNGGNGSVTDVSGTWTVPTVTTTSSCGSSYSAAWVGIDGDTDGTVEQCGTEQDSSGQLYAWYEMYPKGSAVIYSVPVYPGSHMYADVNYGKFPGKFTLTITNTDTGKSYTTTQKLAQAQRNSAEWIMEAPWSGGVLPLADWTSSGFGFSSCTSSLGGPGANPITMVSSDGSRVKAQPGSVGSNNDFPVTWKNCQ